MQSTAKILKGNFSNSKGKKQKTTDATHKHIAVAPLLGDDVQRAKDWLLNRPSRYAHAPTNKRDYTWFCLGINIGFRASDLFTLKVKDVLDRDGDVADRIFRVMQKNGKMQEVPFRPEVRQLLRDWLEELGDWKPDWYLFHSFWPKVTPHIPMSRRRANEILDDLQAALDIKEPLGTHTMRKTLARSTYERLRREDNPLAIQIVMQMLGHSSEAVTRRYLGVTREEVMAAYLMGEMI